MAGRKEAGWASGMCERMSATEARVSALEERVNGLASAVRGTAHDARSRSGAVEGALEECAEHVCHLEEKVKNAEKRAQTLGDLPGRVDERMRAMEETVRSAEERSWMEVQRRMDNLDDLVRRLAQSQESAFEALAGALEDCRERVAEVANEQQRIREEFQGKKGGDPEPADGGAETVETNAPPRRSSPDGDGDGGGAATKREPVRREEERSRRIERVKELYQQLGKKPLSPLC